METGWEVEAVELWRELDDDDKQLLCLIFRKLSAKAVLLTVSTGPSMDCPTIDISLPECLIET